MAQNMPHIDSLALTNDLRKSDESDELDSHQWAGMIYLCSAYYLSRAASGDPVAMSLIN